jgi:hypothetical protein
MREMNKINEYEQNNHDARGANRRERGTKPDLRARVGHRARTVTPRAKTPAVQLLSVRNIPSDILEEIDELAARQGRTRSSFVRRELQRIVVEYRAKGSAQ